VARRAPEPGVAVHAGFRFVRPRLREEKLERAWSGYRKYSIVKKDREIDWRHCFTEG
jgi:hypothetical protein